MAKEKEKVELRPVDEEALPRYVRLRKNLAEEVAEEMEELPPVRVGGGPAAGRLDIASREELKTRSNEPDVGSLIEREIPATEELWETSQATGGTFPWGWVALVACVFTGGILWSLVNVNRAEEKSQALAEEAQAILKKEKREEMDAEVLVGALEGVVRDFFDSRSVEEMLRYVRHPDRVRPLMESYYSGREPEPMRVVRVLSFDPLTIDKRASYWMVSCELEGSMRSQMMLEVISAKEAKVDWETFVCYQPMAWDEFARSRPGGYTGDFRVYVEKDLFHSHEFSDADAFDCYRLTALNGEEALFGYVPRGQGLAARMSEQAAGREDEVISMILRLHVPDGIQSPRGVVVREIVSPRWFFAENPKKGEP